MADTSAPLRAACPAPSRGPTFPRDDSAGAARASSTRRPRARGGPMPDRRIPSRSEDGGNEIRRVERTYSDTASPARARPGVERVLPRPKSASIAPRGLILPSMELQVPSSELPRWVHDAVRRFIAFYPAGARLSLRILDCDIFFGIGCRQCAPAAWQKCTRPDSSGVSDWRSVSRPPSAEREGNSREP
jgi:hypothetical protein